MTTEAQGFPPAPELLCGPSLLSQVRLVCSGSRRGWRASLPGYCLRRTHWMRIPAWTGWGLSKDIIRPAAVPFRYRWSALARQRSGTEKQAVAAMMAEEAPMTAGMPDKDDVDAEVSSRQTLVDRFEAELEAVGGRIVKVGAGGSCRSGDRGVAHAQD